MKLIFSLFIFILSCTKPKDPSHSFHCSAEKINELVSSIGACVMAAGQYQGAWCATNALDENCKKVFSK